MKTDYPILMFPKPAPVSRSKMGGRGGKPHVPSVKDNAMKIGPKFTVLQNALNGRRIHLLQEAESANPEDVLVLETAGRIEDFVNAVKRVEGLEWLLEEDFDGQPDENFYIEKNGKRIEKDLSSRLYLISTNIQALNQIVSLYNQYTKNATEIERGFSKFKDVFEQLREVRFWDYKDRLDGNNFLEEWLRNNEAFPEMSIKFQIEMWYRESSVRRTEAQRAVEELIKSSGGKVLSHCIIEDIRYHALLVEVQATKLRKIIDNIEDGSLIKSRDIMYFKPMPQTIYSSIESEEVVFKEIKQTESVLPSGEPVVALLDGYPLEHHAMLDGRLIIEDPDNFGSQYQVGQRKHGTEMASLIIHGDLSNSSDSLDTPLYVCPIMLPDSEGLEQMPEDLLPVDLVHRTVKRMLRGENGIPASAPHVKIINFSIGDNIRMFSHSMSPMARLLDWLSFQYDVLFVISAGNTIHEVQLEDNMSALKAKGQDEVSKYVTKELLMDRLDHRLLSPAESINNLTVGSVHQDRSILRSNDNRLNPYECVHPAIYTPFGGGLNNSIKPDLVFDGGRQMLQEDIRDWNKLVPSRLQMAPGLQVAYPDNTLNKTIYDRGTSCSTALISRFAYSCYKVLNGILNNNNHSDSHIHLLTKALVVHGCSWENIGDNIEKFLPNGFDTKGIKDVKRQWIGYGYPDFDRSLLCTPQRVTVLGYGELEKEEAHEYRLPLPPSLASKIYKRRVSVTLSWMSPISPQSHRYRKARLWIETTDNRKIAADRMESSDYHASKRGTLQHEVFESEKAYAFQDGDYLGIKVNCAEDAGTLEGKVKYAIVVSLELTDILKLGLFPDNIYEEVRNKLKVPIPIRNTSN